MYFYNLFFIIILSFFHTDIYSISPESNFSSVLIEPLLQAESSMKESLISLYEKGEEVGAGNGGEVHVIDKKYVIKRASKRSPHFVEHMSGSIAFFKKNIRKLNHPHIYNVYDDFEETDDYFYYAASYYPESFSSYFRGLEEKEIQIILLKVLLTLKYLQENNISTDYLKESNIMVSEDKVFKIIDLDLIKEIDKATICIFTGYFYFVSSLTKYFKVYLNKNNDFFEKCTEFTEDLDKFDYPATRNFGDFWVCRKRAITNKFFKQILDHSFFDEVRDEQEIIDLVALIPRNNEGCLPEGLERYEAPLKKAA